MERKQLCLVWSKFSSPPLYIGGFWLFALFSGTDWVRSGAETLSRDENRSQVSEQRWNMCLLTFFLFYRWDCFQSASITEAPKWVRHLTGRLHNSLWNSLTAEERWLWVSVPIAVHWGSTPSLLKDDGTVLTARILHQKAAQVSPAEFHPINITALCFTGRAFWFEPEKKQKIILS